MANTIRIKRRASGSPGAPLSLANAELAFNEVDDTLYYGKGAGGAGGTATTVEAIAGRGSFVALSGDQSIGGQKTFTGQIFVPTPTHASHAVSKEYADAIAAGTYIELSGDVSGNGIGSVTVTLASVGTAGTYTKVTTDAKGRVTSGTTLAAADIPTLAASKISDFDTQVRTSRLDQMAAPTASVSLNGQRLTSVAAPVADTDAANKGYVDAIRQGLDVKDSVRAATVANINLSGTQTIDGISVIANDRVLVKNQSTASQNGIYLVAAGAWTRAADFDTGAKVTSGAFTFVEQGTANADSGWVLTTDGTITLGTTALSFVQFSGAGQVEAGNGLTKTGNTLAVGSGTGITTTATTVALTGQALALHNLATNGIFVRTAADTVTARSIATSGTGISVANGDGVSGNPSLSLTTALQAIGSVTPAADRLVYYTGASAAAVTTFTSFARSLMDDTSASDARTTLGLGSMATQDAGAVAITGGTIAGITFDGGTF
jgi:phage-related tail fiber protein